MQTTHSTSSEESEKNNSSQDLLAAQEIMREEYHIKIDREEQENIQRVLQYLGIEPNFVSSMYTSKGTTLDYIVELSKYELLYLRLVCKTGAIVNISEWTKHAKVSHSDSEV